MATSPTYDIACIGLDDDMPGANLPSDVAGSLLRLYSREAGQPTFLSVPVLMTPNGGGLYVKPALYLG